MTKGSFVRTLPVRAQRSESHFILDQTLAQIAAKVTGEPKGTDAAPCTNDCKAGCECSIPTAYPRSALGRFCWW
jgi:hypothetical protein